MTSEEQWGRIQQTLDYIATLQRSHDEQIGRLVEQGDRNERRIALLTERTIQAMDAINRLANIAARRSHALRRKLLLDSRPEHFRKFRARRGCALAQEQEFHDLLVAFANPFDVAVVNRGTKSA